MILEVSPDAGNIRGDGDVVRLQRIRRANAGQHEQLRCIDHSAAQQDLVIERIEGCHCRKTSPFRNSKGGRG